MIRDIINKNGIKVEHPSVGFNWLIVYYIWSIILCRVIYKIMKPRFKNGIKSVKV